MVAWLPGIIKAQRHAMRYKASMKTIISMLAAALVSGCVGITPKYTIEEMDAITTREYAGKTKDEVFAAATRVFNASDDGNFKIQRFGGELKATSWHAMIFNALIFEWRVLPEDSANGVVVRVNSASKIDALEMPNLTGKGVYELFFGRLDYMLRLSNSWPTCAEATNRIFKEKGRGDVAALCYSYANNSDEPSPPR